MAFDSPTNNFTLYNTSGASDTLLPVEATTLGVVESTLLESVNQTLAAAVPTSVGGIPTDALPIDILKYGRYYNSFFASGLAALIILVGLFIYIGYKKYQRTNPMGIMFNLVLIQIMLTIRIFMVGLFF
jgi:hypothetical protein